MSTPTLYVVTGKDDLLKRYKIERRKEEIEFETQLKKVKSHKKAAQGVVDACQKAIDSTEKALLNMKKNTLVLCAFKEEPTLETYDDAIAWLVKKGYIVNGNPSEKWDNA